MASYNRRKSHKSHKRVTHRRKNRKRVTHRRKRNGGSYPHSVDKIRQAYEALKEKTKTMTLDNYEDIRSEAKALHKEATNTGNSKLAQQIQGYEYGVINQEFKKLQSKPEVPEVPEVLKEPTNTVPEEFLD
jgi:hypothetical protein